MVNEKRDDDGDAGLAQALLAELGDTPPSDALIYDERGNPVSKAAKRRASESE